MLRTFLSSNNRRLVTEKNCQSGFCETFSQIICETSFRVCLWCPRRKIKETNKCTAKIARKELREMFFNFIGFYILIFGQQINLPYEKYFRLRVVLLITGKNAWKTTKTLTLRAASFSKTPKEIFPRSCCPTTVVDQFGWRQQTRFRRVLTQEASLFTATICRVLWDCCLFDWFAAKNGKASWTFYKPELRHFHLFQSFRNLPSVWFLSNFARTIFIIWYRSSKSFQKRAAD